MKFTHPTALAVVSLLISAFAEPGSSTKDIVTGTHRSPSLTMTASNLTVSPTSLTFGPIPVNSFVYAMVTITNTGDAADYIASATPVEGTFFATFAGTCNTSVDPNDPLERNYWIPAGGSCTFQWGYHPTTRGGGKPPWTQTGSGTLTFDSHAPISISFTGLATPH